MQKLNDDFKKAKRITDHCKLINKISAKAIKQFRNNKNLSFVTKIYQFNKINILIKKIMYYNIETANIKKILTL